MERAELERELERLHPACWGWALACCRPDRDIAEEALQAAYLKVLSGQARFDGRSSIRTWVFAVIRRTAMEEVRRRRTRHAREPGSEIEAGLTFDDVQGAGLNGKYALRPVTRQLTARASYAPWASVRALVEGMDARRATEDGYATGNVRMEWSHRRMGVTLDVNNLTNATWLDASGIGVAGHALYVGVAWR